MEWPAGWQLWDMRFVQFPNGKVLPCGEGGMLTTNDEKFAERAHSFANQGRVKGESFFKHFYLSSNLRLTAFQAAVLIAQFERLPDQIRQRTANAVRLKELLEDMPEIAWQQVPAEVTQTGIIFYRGDYAENVPAATIFTMP